jgi:hypothetical protein
VTAVEGEQVGGNLTGHQLHPSSSQGQAGQAFQAHVLGKKKRKNILQFYLKSLLHLSRVNSDQGWLKNR